MMKNKELLTILAKITGIDRRVIAKAAQTAATKTAHCKDTDAYARVLEAELKRSGR